MHLTNTWPELLNKAVLCCSLPSLLERVFPTPMGGPGLQIFIQIYNTIFLFVFICVSYGIVRIAPLDSSCSDMALMIAFVFSYLISSIMPLLAHMKAAR